MKTKLILLILLQITGKNLLALMRTAKSINVILIETLIIGVLTRWIAGTLNNYYVAWQSAAKRLNKDEGSETIEKQHFTDVELSRVGNKYIIVEAPSKFYSNNYVISHNYIIFVVNKY